MRLESRLYRTVQDTDVQMLMKLLMQVICMTWKPMLSKPVPREHVYGTPGISRCRRIWLLGRGAYIKYREAHRVL